MSDLDVSLNSRWILVDDTKYVGSFLSSTLVHLALDHWSCSKTSCSSAYVYKQHRNEQLISALRVLIDYLVSYTVA